MKKVCNALYVHKSNVNELYNHLERDFCLHELINFLSLVSEDYTVIKFEEKTRNITLIKSSDFDTANEPLIDYTIKCQFDSWYTNGTKTGIKRINGKQIYHNKWMFVSPEYTGFNIAESRKRTEIWNGIPNIKEHKSRIGYKNYWVKLLNQYNIPV